MGVCRPPSPRGYKNEEGVNVTASIVKPLKRGTKTITGEVMRNGLGIITLWVIDKNGSGAMQTYRKDRYKVIIHT